MKRRKRIAFFTSLPEGVHARHVTDGMLYQCQKYDYDLFIKYVMRYNELQLSKTSSEERKKLIIY